MGLFSGIKKGFKKIGKGIKSAFKSIGKGIKSAMGKIGKFMNKIGIVGQLALMFTPLGPMVNSMFASIGSAVGGAFSAVVGQTATQATVSAVAQQAAVTAGAQAGATVAAVEAGKAAAVKLASGVANKTLTKTITDGVVSYAGKATGLMGGGTIAKGAGTLLQSAGNFAKAGHSAFRTITDGLTSFVSEFSKTALKKIPGMQNMMPKYLGDSVSDNFFSGEGSAWSKVQGVVSENANAALNSFNEAIGVEAPIPKVTTEIAKTNYDDKGSSDYTAQTDTGTAVTEDKSLLSQGIDKVTTSYDKWKGDRTFGEALVETGIDKVQAELKGIPDEIAGGLKTRAYQAIGLEAKPEYVSNQYSAYVPTIDTARAGQYASAEINDRAMQIQLTGSNFHMQNPYGFGANEYLNRMAIATGGTA
tara:strand:+ start:1130 stop:2380 length:1251 start_codon:yes stop_codon:yes gene_type:complete